MTATTRPQAWTGSVAWLCLAGLLATGVVGCEPLSSTRPVVESVTEAGQGVNWSSGLGGAAYVVVHSADLFTCAGEAWGEVRCWGDSYVVDADWPATLDWIDLDAAGAGEICAALADGGVRCWGDAADTDVRVFAGAEMTDIDVGHGHQVCGVTSAGDVRCASHSYLGRDFGLSDAPLEGVWDSVTGGEFHTCALSAFGTISCWGRDDSAIYSAQLASPGGADFVQMDAGTYHTCAVKDSGAVRCWGAGEVRRDPEPLTMLAHVGQADPPEGLELVEVASGAFHTCGLERAGTAVCWGDGSRGQLGAPLRDDLVALSAGWDHTCAVTAAGVVVCWGEGAYAY